MKYRVYAKCESEVAYIVEAESPSVAARIVSEALDSDDGGADLECEVTDQGTTTLTGDVQAA